MESFDFTLIQKEFDQLLFATENTIKREWSKKYSRLENGKLLTLMYFQFAVNYHNSVISLSEDNKNKMLSLSLTPLVRANFEILYILIYFFSDVLKNTKRFSVSIYREQKRVVDIWNENYKGQPTWDEEIKKSEETLLKGKEAFKIDFGLNAFNEVDWENDKKNRFPTLRQMKEHFEKTNFETYAFLQLIDNLWYRELSIFSHSEPFGLVQLRPILMNEKGNHLESFKNTNLWLSLIWILSISSEIAIHLNHNLFPQLAYIWGWFAKLSPKAEEIYTSRYQKLLNSK